MSKSEEPTNPLPGSNSIGDTNLVKSLTLKEYLETATDASRRTRFITIIMVVASVLVLVSVLNSSDFGWITLRLNALRHPVISKYTVRKFPLLCKCDNQVRENQEVLCNDLEGNVDYQDLFNAMRIIDNGSNNLKCELEILEVNKIEAIKAGQEAIEKELGGRALPQSEREATIKAQREAIEKEFNERKALMERELNSKQSMKALICDDEKKRLASFTETMQRSASETKYTVRVPFFGVAFDINDIGILGGLSLWIILILLRLGLRSQIVSLRIGFKEAFECNQQQNFYEILATRQQFIFPPLRDRKQKDSVARGWIEMWWRMSKVGEYYQKKRLALLRRVDRLRSRILKFFKITDIPENRTFVRGNEREDQWYVNRNMSLRIIPKALCLLPFGIYFLQYSFDIYTRHYGYELSPRRTWLLLGLGGFFLLNILIFGVWCVTKWNELDRLWDYYDRLIKEGRTPWE